MKEGVQNTTHLLPDDKHVQITHAEYLEEII
jgi:hypothetical protein